MLRKVSTLGECSARIPVHPEVVGGFPGISIYRARFAPPPNGFALGLERFLEPVNRGTGSLRFVATPRASPGRRPGRMARISGVIPPYCMEPSPEPMPDPSDRGETLLLAACSPPFNSQE
jgi:hypothetical protein